MRLRLLSSVCGALVVLGACSSGGDVPFEGVDNPIEPYEGLGTWVDAFDYAPAFQDGAPPPVTPATVEDMADLGASTLFLQAAKDDARSPDALVDEELVGDFVRAAHDHDLDVVAWYLPTYDNLAADMARIEAIEAFEVDGRGFDGIALDIEWTESVPDPQARNRALVRLTRRTRDLIGDDAALGAIVFPAVQTDVINPVLWPDFPYDELEPMYDVWMPMAYWTFREGEYRDPARYTVESIDRLREHLDDADVRVHPIGGIGDLATPADYESFLQAVADTDSIGWSIYDFATTASTAWSRLRDG